MNEPTRFTAPLLANDEGLPVHSAGYALVELAHKYIKVGGKPLVLDVWQQHLLIRILERCPPGHARAGQARYSAVVVSVPRQNGKSLLASLLSLYGLLQHHERPEVLGLARGVEQARIVYGYTADAIASSRVLSARLHKTETRGIRNIKTGGRYKVLPARQNAIQGYLSTLAIVDELHVLEPGIWDAVVTSQKAQPNGIIIGITTAGDSNSVLLKRLYKQGASAIEGKDETFGFFCWEAPEDCGLDVESITIANPAVACGRISAEKTLGAERNSPEANWRRFTLNQFWEGQAEPWVPAEDWAACKGAGVTEKKNLIYAIDTTRGLGFASVVVARKNGDVIETQLVAQIEQPNIEQLERVAKQLAAKNGRGVFVMDTYVLKELADRLTRARFEVVPISAAGNRQSAALAYSLIKRHQVSHNNDAVVNEQSRHATTRFTGEAFRLIRGKTGRDIDAVMATTYAIFVAATHKKRSIGIAA